MDYFLTYLLVYSNSDESFLGDELLTGWNECNWLIASKGICLLNSFVVQVTFSACLPPRFVLFLRLASCVLLAYRRLDD